ncbi:SDR family NAD(P)-dependent oxidoreductase [Pseudonocardia halophobica]|uniref:SDR family NAD(P)-dependent oxidoreductase n=1 Tax=Pseudonocardia halophobica TaxID=29401 RepID=UPI003D8C0F19
MSLKGLQGKVAIVTGGAQGIGAASAKRLVEEGAKVAIVDLDEAQLKAYTDSLGGESLAIAADAASPEGVDAYVAQTVEAFGRIDIAHLNVGIGNKPAFIADTETDDYDRVMNVNMRGAYLSLKAVLKQFAAQGGGGAIAMTSSINGIGGTPGMTIYTMSKHGIVGLVRSAAREYGPQGIRINAVLPGNVETKALVETMAQMGNGDELRTMMESTIPLGRWAKPDEIGGAVAWLLSDESSYVTGSAMVIDGGATVGATSFERFTEQ